MKFITRSIAVAAALAATSWAFAQALNQTAPQPQPGSIELGVHLGADSAFAGRFLGVVGAAADLRQFHCDQLAELHGAECGRNEDAPGGFAAQGQVSAGGM